MRVILLLVVATVVSHCYFADNGRGTKDFSSHQDDQKAWQVDNNVKRDARVKRLVMKDLINLNSTWKDGVFYTFNTSDRLRGRPRLQPARIRTVWNCHIGTHQDYFYKVLVNVTLRDDGINEILMPKQHTQNEDEREFVLRLLAHRMASFFQSIITDGLLTNIHELKNSCYKLGQQHSGYSKEPFKLVYWDMFTLALLEELENRGGTPREELRAWQTLLHIVNENMLAGYLDAKRESRE